MPFCFTKSPVLSTLQPRFQQLDWWLQRLRLEGQTDRQGSADAYLCCEGLERRVIDASLDVIRGETGVPFLVFLQSVIRLNGGVWKHQ